MKTRCNNPRSTGYELYGGRGIKICNEWEDFKSFYEWANASGYRDDLSIDRIAVNGNYEPNNCRWATSEEQGNNVRTNHLVTYFGKTQTLKQWAKELNINYKTIFSRYSRGWSIEQMLSTSVKGVR